MNELACIVAGVNAPTETQKFSANRLMKSNSREPAALSTVSMFLGVIPGRTWIV